MNQRELKMSKRDPSTDVPRRIYASTIERIDSHLEKRPRNYKKNIKRKVVKGYFNEFLVFLLDYYEATESAPRKFVTQTFETLEEARGDAILKSVKTKEPVKWPEVVVVVGKDG